jgi:hypothetical protein
VGHHQAYHHTIMGFSKGHEWERGRKSIWRNNGLKHSKFDEKYQSTHSKSSMNFK